MSEKYFGTSGTYVIDNSDRIITKQMDQTLGNSTQFLTPLITNEAAQAVSSLDNKDMGRLAQELLGAIEKSARSYQAVGGEISNLEPVKVFHPEDGSILIEWTNPDFRLGFTIEPEIQDSGWYIVTSKRLGDLGLHGSLSSKNVDELAALTFRFLKSNT